MKLSHAKMPPRPLLLTLVLVALAVDTASAITLGQLSDFQDGTAQGWGTGFGALPVIADSGPSGAGDSALRMTTSDGAGVGKLLVIADPNRSDVGGTAAAQWMGNWTAAGIAQIQLDIQNQSDADLLMRLGIAGPLGGPYSHSGGGDTHVTQAITVPADNQWHTITFDVLASDFTSVGGEGTPAGALADVKHIRILHNSFASFVGEFIELGPGEVDGMLLDNIRAIGASAGLDGDYNGNGVVDAADYTVWRDTLGQAGADLPADGTGPGGTPDGIVNQLDYDFWKANFGAGGATGSASAVAVPEPAAGLLLIAAWYSPVRRRRLG